MKVVGIGGGTGLPVLLRGLKQISRSHCGDTSSEPLEISAIVCVSDNGGSSGHLRQSFGIPAVGDLRNCLVALSNGDPLIANLFQYRFRGTNGLAGHALGNLIVTALCKMTGGLGNAAELAKEVLGLRGCVLPVTETAPTLCAELENGETIRGEWQITAAGSRIRRVWLEPRDIFPYDGVLQSLADADAIVLGPGSLYTSVIPNLLVKGVVDEIRRSSAVKIFVCNLVTQLGETHGMTASDHLEIVETYLGPHVLDICLLNCCSLDPALEKKYGDLGSEAVRWDEDAILSRGVVPVAVDLLEEDAALKIRHDPMKLARAITFIAGGLQRAGEATAIRKVAA